MIWICVKLYWVLSDRREAKRRLRGIIKGTEDDRARTMARKLMALHFKVGIDDKGNEFAMRRSDLKTEIKRRKSLGCVQCGRKKEAECQVDLDTINSTTSPSAQVRAPA